MLLAESAVFLCLHTIRMCLLILLGIVVSVLALCAGKCNSGTHFFTSYLSYRTIDHGLIYSTKKRPMIVSPDKYNTVAILRQSDFAFFFFTIKPAYNVDRLMNIYHILIRSGNHSDFAQFY